jgi:hypothetical protein
MYLVEVASPSFTRPRAAGLYDVPLLTFDSAERPT